MKKMLLFAGGFLHAHLTCNFWLLQSVSLALTLTALISIDPW